MNAMNPNPPARRRGALRRHLFFLFALLPGLSAAPCAHGAAPQDLAVLARLAEQHAAAAARQVAPAGARVRAEASQLDTRLRLPECSEEPRAFSPPGQSATNQASVGLRCAAPAWSIYVPVRLEVLAPVAVLASPAARGEALTSAQVRLEERDITRMPGGYLPSLEAVEGMVLRRPVPAGTALTPSMLEAPLLVRRGDRVPLRAARPGFQVHAEAEALSNGAAGDRVRVRNIHSRRVVEGVVENDGSVRIGG